MKVLRASQLEKFEAEKKRQQQAQAAAAAAAAKAKAARIAAKKAQAEALDRQLKKEARSFYGAHADALEPTWGIFRSLYVSSRKAGSTAGDWETFLEHLPINRAARPLSRDEAHDAAVSNLRARGIQTGSKNWGTEYNTEVARLMQGGSGS